MSSAPLAPDVADADDVVRPSPRTVTLLGSALVTSLLVLVMAMTPAPYVVQSPGPTVDTLGETDGRPLIEVRGAQTYPTEGSLLLTTVSVRGGPGTIMDPVRVVRGWLSGEQSVVPVEQVYPTGQTRDERDEIAAAEMTTSQENATAAALTELGLEVPAALVAAGAAPGSGADGVIEVGDLLVAVDGVDLATFQTLSNVLAATPPGTTLEVDVIRDGERTTVPVVTGDDGSGGSVLGLFIDPEFDFPVDVSIRIEEIGGPSAGTMFALGIIDTLTPGAMTGGENVAGTGTISIDGDVGPIDGIRQKMAGAARDGSRFFLAPVADCPEVLGYEPDGVQVIPVATLAEAREAVEAIGEGRADRLPACAVAA